MQTTGYQPQRFVPQEERRGSIAFRGRIGVTDLFAEMIKSLVSITSKTQQRHSVGSSYNVITHPTPLYSPFPKIQGRGERSRKIAAYPLLLISYILGVSRYRINYSTNVLLIKRQSYLKLPGKAEGDYTKQRQKVGRLES